jgi:hypothetical protein
MSLIKNVLIFSALLCSLNAYSVDYSASINLNSQQYLKTIIENIDKFSQHSEFVVETFHRPRMSRNDTPAYILIEHIISEFSERLTEYQILSLANTKKNTSKKSKKKTQSKKQKKNKEKDLEKKQKTLLKEIAERCSDYLFSRQKTGLEFFQISLHKGLRIPESNMHIPLEFLDPETAQKHADNCSILTDKALAPVDYFIKMILDFFALLIAEKPHLAEHIKPYLIIDLDDKLIDSNITAYALRPANNDKSGGETVQGLVIHSSKTRIPTNYVIFIRQDNGEYVGGAISNASKDLFWIVSKLDINTPDVYTKLYANFKAAKSGLLFTMFADTLFFLCYQSGEPILPFTQWTGVQKGELDSARALKPGIRLILTYNISLGTTVQFIEFDEVSNLQKIIDEIKKAGFLDQVVLLDLVEWLLNNEADKSIAHEVYPPFYPKKLIKLRQREWEEQQNLELIQANKKLEKQFVKVQQKKSPLVYKDRLNEILSRNTSIGSRLFQKCVGLWWMAHEKETIESRQKGSHLQIAGAPGEPTRTFVRPHGLKAKNGLPTKAVIRSLRDI